MNYRTTCPHCSSVFRVGADQLDAAQGWAQCGVCGAAFDARASLLTEDGSPLPVAPVQTAEVEPTPAEATVPAAAAPAETAAPAPQVPAEEPAAPASPEHPPEPAAPPVGIAQREATSDLSSIIIIDPDIPVPDDYGALPQIPATQASGSSAMPLMYPQPYSRETVAAAAPATRIEYSKPVHPDSPTGAPNARRKPDNAYVAPTPRRSRGGLWGGASVLLLALLLAQGAYFLRDTLVSELPQTRPALERMCALLSCTLSLPKDLTLLQIVGSDLETETSGRLKLTLTLGNRADHAQAWPVLVLTLTDQRNQPLARRSFAPSEYLGDAQRIAAGMPPRSEQPLSLPLTVHGLKPMGFDLQLVY